jgi:hypothetical protein
MPKSTANFPALELVMQITELHNKRLHIQAGELLSELEKKQDLFDSKIQRLRRKAGDSLALRIAAIKAEGNKLKEKALLVAIANTASALQELLDEIQAFAIKSKNKLKNKSDELPALAVNPKSKVTATTIRMIEMYIEKITLRLVSQVYRDGEKQSPAVKLLKHQREYVNSIIRPLQSLAEDCITAKLAEFKMQLLVESSKSQPDFNLILQSIGSISLLDDEIFMAAIAEAKEKLAQPIPPMESDV